MSGLPTLQIQVFGSTRITLLKLEFDFPALLSDCVGIVVSCSKTLKNGKRANKNVDYPGGTEPEVLMTLF